MLFPADGEYEFRINGAGIVTIDGVQGPDDRPCRVKAGMHKVGLANRRSAALSSPTIPCSRSSRAPAEDCGGGGGGRGGRGGVPAGAVQVVGPYTPLGTVAETENRQQRLHLQARK